MFLITPMGRLIQTVFTHPLKTSPWLAVHPVRMRKIKTEQTPSAWHFKALADPGPDVLLQPPVSSQRPPARPVLSPLAVLPAALL